MGLLDALEKVFDINFAPDIDINNISLIDYDGGDKLQKEGKSLQINISELEPEERKELLDVPPSQFEVQERVLQDEAEDDANAIESGYSEDYDEILEYFDGVISERYLEILDVSLHLRGLIKEKNLDRREIQSKKRDIARRHGPNAVYLSSLVSAGYFDPNGGLRDLYVDMGLNKQYDRYNFQQELETLVDKKLLCVFVENDETVEEVTQEVRGRLVRYQREEPIHDWFDIRGIGDGCQEIIDGVVDNLEDEFISIDIEQWQTGEDHHVRIRPHSVGEISESR